MPATVTLDEFQARLARRIRAMAARRGMSLTQLAAEAEMADRTLWNILAGRHDTSLDSLVKIAAVLRVDPGKLLQPERRPR